MKLETEQFVMSMMGLCKELNNPISLHLKLLHVSVLNVPVITWQMSHDLSLRSEKLLLIGLERFRNIY